MNFKNLLAHSLAWRGIYYISLLVLNIVISRHLLAPGSGNLFYLTNLFAFLQLFFSLTLENSLTYFGASGKVSMPSLFWFSIVWCAGISLLLYLLSFLSATGFDFFRQYFFYAFTYIIGLTLANFVTALFYVQRNFYVPNLLSVLLNFMLAFFIVIKGDAIDSEITRLYFLLFISHGVLLTVAYACYNRKMFYLKLPVITDIKKILRFSGLALAANVVFFLVYRIDYWFVKNSPVCNATDLGNYIQASKLGQMLLLMPQIMASVIFPQTASGAERAAVNDAITIVSRLFSQAFVIIFLLLLVSGKWLFTLVFGDSFEGMYWPFIILLPGIFSLCVQVLLSAYFSGKGKIKVNITGAIIALVVVATGDAVFIPLYGINAAAAVSTLGYSAGMLYALYCFYRDYKINFFSFFRWRITDYHWLKTVLNKSGK